MDDARALPRDYLDWLLKLGRRALRFWWIAVVALVVGTVATVYLLNSRTPKYESQAVVYYQEGIQWNFAGDEGASTRRVGQRLKAILLARAQIQKLIEELNLYPHMVKAGKMADAVEGVLLGITFRINEGDTFTISYVGESPLEAQRVTAKLTEILIDENTRLRSQQADVAKDFLDAEKKRNEENLRLKETEMAQFLNKHPEFAHELTGGSNGVGIRATTKKAAPEPAATNDPVLLALMREEERLRKQITSPADARGVQDPALIAAKNDAETKLNAARKDLAEKRAKFTEQHPDVRAAAAQVKSLEDAYKHAVDALRPPAASEGVVEIEPKAALTARLAQVQQEIRDYKQRKGRDSAAEPAPVSSNDAAQRIVALETDYAQLNREITEARERLKQLDSKQFLAAMAASSLTSGQAARITVIDPANLPAQPMGTSNKKLLLAGIALALGLGLAVAILMGIIDDRIYDRTDVERLDLAPVLIEIPRLRIKGRASG